MWDYNHYIGMQLRISGKSQWSMEPYFLNLPGGNLAMLAITALVIGGMSLLDMPPPKKLPDYNSKQFRDEIYAKAAPGTATPAMKHRHSKRFSQNEVDLMRAAARADPYMVSALTSHRASLEIGQKASLRDSMRTWRQVEAFRSACAKAQLKNGMPNKKQSATQTNK